MELFQILDCSSTLGNCCNTPGLVSILNIARRVLELIQLIAPIVLVIAGTIQFTQLSINPEMKDGFRRVLNKLMAAFFIFFIPFILDAVLTVVPGDFSVAACWNQAKVSDETFFVKNGKYIGKNDSKEKLKSIFDYSDYERGEKPPEPTPGDSEPNQGMGSGVGKGSAKGKAIAAYALQFEGKPYVFGGYWNGELPYTPTDCSGFVTGVFRHFGINLPRGVNMFGYDTSLYTVVTGEIHAGDVVMYDGHVGILTGNGKEIIHAKGTKWGVVRDSDYTKCSSHSILGVLRIKGTE